MSLAWSTNKSVLQDGKSYLVKMKHGIIEGSWNAEYEYFYIYLWRDLEFHGYAWVPIEDVK